MYGTEINIKITDFDDDHEEIEEIITWLTYMLKKSKLRQAQEDELRQIKLSSKKKAAPQLPLSLDTIKEEDDNDSVTEELVEQKKPEKKISDAPRFKCACGVEYVKKNKSRHEKSAGHLKYLENNNI